MSKTIKVDTQVLCNLRSKVKDLEVQPLPEGSKRAFKVWSNSVPWWALKKMVYNLILAAKETQLSHRA